MQTMIRHMGFPVQDMTKATEFWERMGLSMVGMSIETWGDRRLKITKLGDVYGAQVELVKGDWPYHVAVGVSEFPNDLDIIHYKSGHHLDVAFYHAPGGGVVEMVRAK